jgi:hypothetical protein
MLGLRACTHKIAPILGAQKAESPHTEGFQFHCSFKTLLHCSVWVFQSLLHFPDYIVTLQDTWTYAKFFAAKSQFTMFQNASTNFGRALR